MSGLDADERAGVITLSQQLGLDADGPVTIDLPTVVSPWEEISLARDPGESENEEILMTTYVDPSGQINHIDDAPAAPDMADPAALKGLYTPPPYRLEDAYGEEPQWQRQRREEQEASRTLRNDPETRAWVIRARASDTMRWREPRDREGNYAPEIEDELAMRQADREWRGGLRFGDRYQDGIQGGREPGAIYRGDYPDLDDFVARAHRELRTY